MYDAPLGLATVTAPAPRRQRVLVVATGFVTAGVLMYFAALLGLYLASRATQVQQGRDWLPDGVTIPLTQPNMLLATLLLSVVTIHWASYSARNDDRPNLYLSLGITLMFGVAFINQNAYLFNLMELDVEGGRFEVLVYALTVSHLLMLLGAIAFLVVVAFRALGGQETSVHHDGIRAAALFWDAMVAVFFLIWIAVYVTK